MEVNDKNRMRVAFVLPGLHRYDRGAEIAFVAIASELVDLGHDVTLIGSGRPRPSQRYRFLHVASVARERFESFPSLPVFRNETAYEDATFSLGLIRRYRPSDFDITVSCSYPFTNWVLRRPARRGRPPHVFVTQNGDWPALSRTSEYRLFGCEGLVCTNPDYYARNDSRWPSSLIPNGIDLARFAPGRSERAQYDLPEDRPVVLMVSALIASKRVVEGIRAVSKVENAHLVVAGDGPMRALVDRTAVELMPGRFTRITLASNQMPSLYRSADAFLHLSRNESFGNVFVEAMACGLPVVAHDMPRTRWIVGNEEYLVDTLDQKEITAGISAALQKKGGSLRDSRIERATEYAWPKIAAQYEEFFASVIDRHRRSQLNDT